ncbi:uncharacterized protein LOC127283941 [Leptopilina boulardi]|uniref:uncharacterized protein LOC127283941 n=1 Tax=Leptopilina boulardi TaxID=63433 RepID=UPI0021F635D0|nr:uncharacterized protein LOC127283941 [Leptopilina boulardi]
MKCTLVLALVATCLSLSLAHLPKRQGPPVLINRPPPPKPHHYAREANPQGSVSATVQQPLSGPDRRPTYNLDYNHNIWEGKNGHVSASGGAVKLPGQRWEPQVGIQGQWRFRREANPQGSVSATVQKPLSGPERRPTYNIDYNHKIWEGKNGQVSASGGAVKLPGQRWEPQVGIRGQWRFRREANPQGSVSGTYQQPLSGPDRRPTYNIDYNHKIWEGKNGHVSASGGAAKFPGQRWQPQVGIQGQWRF